MKYPDGSFEGIPADTPITPRGRVVPVEARKIVGFVPMTTELIEEAKAVQAVLQEAEDRWLRPWLFPDPCPFPELVLFPRLAKAAAKIRVLLRS